MPKKIYCSSDLTFKGPCIVIYFYSKTNKMHRCIKFILFWNDTLHASEGISVHHQELKTVYTAIAICQTDTAVCLLASRQQYLFDFLTPLGAKKNFRSAVRVHLCLMLCYYIFLTSKLQIFYFLWRNGRQYLAQTQLDVHTHTHTRTHTHIHTHTHTVGII